MLYPVKFMFDWVFCVLAYRLYTVVPRLVKFIDYLTNVYVRMNRKRIRVWNKFYFSRDFYFPENFTSGHNLNKTPPEIGIFVLLRKFCSCSRQRDTPKFSCAFPSYSQLRYFTQMINFQYSRLQTTYGLVIWLE